MARGALAIAAAAVLCGGCGGPSAPPPGPGAAIVQLAYSNDGRRLAIVRASGPIEVVALAGAERWTIAVAQGTPAPRVALSEDGALLAAAADGQVGLWAVESGSLVRRLVVGMGRCQALKFSDSAAPLLLAAFDRDANPGDNIKIWRVSDGVLVGTLAQGALATFTYADEAVLVAEPGRGYQVFSFGGRQLRQASFPQALSALAFAADGAYLAGVARTPDGAEPVAILSVADDGFVWRSSELNRGTRQLLFLENPSRVLQLGERALLYDQENGRLLIRLVALEGLPHAVASPDGEVIAAATAEGTIRFVSSGDGLTR
jgi:hypothetical protein